MGIVNMGNEGSCLNGALGIFCLTLLHASMIFIYFFLQLGIIISETVETQDSVTHPGQIPFVHASVSWHLGMI